MNSYCTTFFNCKHNYNDTNLLHPVTSESSSPPLLACALRRSRLRRLPLRLLVVPQTGRRRAHTVSLPAARLASRCPGEVVQRACSRPTRLLLSTTQQTLKLPPKLGGHCVVKDRVDGTGTNMVATGRTSSSWLHDSYISLKQIMDLLISFV